ncbi:MAG: hypothetical protein Q8Q12_15195 [bacterium]|nr:hypothetical protein [bacterium]
MHVRRRVTMQGVPRFPFVRVVVWTAFVCFGLVGRIGLNSHAEGDLCAIRSYDGNFLVTAPDHSTCAWAGKVAELTRQRVFNLLGHHAEWSDPATILLRSQASGTEAEGPQLWAITVAKSDLEVRYADVYPNKRGDLLVLSVVNVCLGDMAGLGSPEGARGPAGNVPAWLVCGAAENLSRGNLADLRNYAADIASQGNYIPFKQLLQAETIPSDETQRELFFRQSGSIMDFLLHQKDGKSKLREVVLGLATKDDSTTPLFQAFATDFETLSQLEQTWKEFAIRQAERTIGGAKMLLSETREALEDVLTVKIPIVDKDTLEEKIVTTDLNGLFRHSNRRLVQQIASEKASDVFRLSLKSRPEYGPILQEYLQALTAVARSERSEFKRHFAIAERLRKELEESAEFKEGTESGNPGDQ